MTQILEDCSVEGAHRPAWRQRLVDAEKGFRIGIRSDSTLFVFFFFAGVILLTAAICGLPSLHWAILTLTLGISLVFELLHQLLKQLTSALQDLAPAMIDSSRLATTASLAAHLTTATVTIILFWKRFAGLW